MNNTTTTTITIINAAHYEIVFDIHLNTSISHIKSFAYKHHYIKMLQYNTYSNMIFELNTSTYTHSFFQVI